MILVIAAVVKNLKNVVVFDMVGTVSKRGWQSWLELCEQAQSEKQLEQLLQFFLTAEERDALSMRVELIRELLKKEKPQRQISKDLNVSIAKITRGSNELKTISRKFDQFLRTILC